jgi:hypothetical protein
MHDERWSLVLIHHFDPPLFDEDSLKVNIVVVNIIRYRASFGNMNVGGNETPSQAVRAKVPVLHSRPSFTPFASILKLAEINFREEPSEVHLLRRGQRGGGGAPADVGTKAEIVVISLRHFDLASVWCCENMRACRWLCCGRE